MKFTYPVLMASALSVGSARAINEAAFEGGVLEIRQATNWQSGSCYSTSGDLQLNGTSIYQSSGACRDIANKEGHTVLALTGGDTCYTGNDLPPDSDKIDQSKCNINCRAWPDEKCGGQGAYLVWTNNNFDTSGSQSSSPATSTPATTTSSAPSVVQTTVGGTTIVITNPAEAAAATVSVTSSSDPNSGSGSTNKGAIAAGVVVGIVGLAAIVGGAFLFMRSRKQRAEAAELQRQNSSSGFASRGEKPPSTYSLSDSRLEPTFMRRMSDGSIADNQDYSRRILKVTNPDDR